MLLIVLGSMGCSTQPSPMPPRFEGHYKIGAGVEISVEERGRRGPLIPRDPGVHCRDNGRWGMSCRFPIAAD